MSSSRYAGQGQHPLRQHALPARHIHGRRERTQTERCLYGNQQPARRFKTMKCLVYRNKAAVMQEIIDRLGRGWTNGEKTRLVKKLGQAADSLLTCPDYKHDSQDCKNCRAVAQRRKNMMWAMLKNMKTAPIIIPADQRRP